MTAHQTPRRRVSLSDVAKKAGVSTSAASFALNGRIGVSDPVRVRVKDAAQVLGYVPWTSAVAMRTGRSGAVGLLIRNMRNPFFLDVINGFDRTCATAGLGVIIGSADYSSERENELVTTFIAREVDGLALAPIGGGDSASRWQSMTGKPLVLINGAKHAPELDTSRVHVDSEDAVRQAVDHLRSLGHRRIALVAAPSDQSADNERVEIFRELATHHRIDARIVETLMQYDRATEVLSSILREDPTTRPTAFITNSDYIASALYSAAASVGVAVGSDVSVIGHDDLSTSRLLAPSLSTIAVDRFQIGVAAATSLIQELEGGARQTVIIPARLVPRDSTSSRPTGP